MSLNRINKLIEQGEIITEASNFSSYEQWKREVQFFIEKVGNPSMIKEVEKEVNRRPLWIMSTNTPKDHLEKQLLTHKKSQLQRLLFLLKAIKEQLGFDIQSNQNDEIRGKKKISKSNVDYKDNRKSNIDKSHVHDNIDISGTGHTVNVNKTRHIILPKEEGWLDQLTRLFGRWLVGKKRKIGLPIIAIPSLGSFYVMIDWVWLDLIESINNDLKLWIRGISIFWLIVMYGLFIMLKQEVCPKCKRLLAIRTVKRELLGKERYQGRLIHNIRETYKCDFCNYTDSKTITEKG